ncbi:protein far1-related sequence 5-like [Gigaspora margarita]|uniref:Protein far1-related sequence 5-like n=1 Tax=Gigaspora margarita TaxID=4874 RepID=A0A8H4AUP2_GIGMA|nr:protein far1-related sequence 5-like [Gigaspora margarita]
MEDKLTIAALEVDIDSPNLKVEYFFSPFDVECTTTTVIKVEDALSNLEVGFTSPVLKIEKTSSSLYTKTTPIYTYQPLEVTPLNSTHQYIDIYNAIYRLCERYKDEKPDSGLFIEALFEKMVHNPGWKVYVRHLGSERHLAGVFWMSPDQQDLLEDELQYNKLVDLKASNTLIGLPYLFSQFFTNIDAILVQFLTFLILSWQQFQISQSLTYKGCLVSFSVKILEIDTVNDAFIEDVNNEPQITLKSLLNGVEVSSKLEHHDVICYATSLRNRFGIAFSVSKTAINIALETNSDEELIRMLKNFIIVKRLTCKDSTRSDSNNSYEDSTKNESDEVVPLQ